MFSLLLLVTTLAIVHAKPSPVWVYLMSIQGAKEAANEKQMVQSDKDMTANTEDTLLPEQSQKEAVNSQIGEPLFAEMYQELKRVKAQDDCPWPPALCGDGGTFGEPLNYYVKYN